MKNKEVVLILLVAMLLTACNKVDNERSTRSSLDYEGFDKTDYLEVESSVSTEESEETSTSATGMGVETIIEVPDDADENGCYAVVVDYYGNSGWYYYGNVSDISDELIGGDYVGVRPAIYLSVD